MPARLVELCITSAMDSSRVGFTSPPPACFCLRAACSRARAPAFSIPQSAKDAHLRMACVTAFAGISTAAHGASDASTGTKVRQSRFPLIFQCSTVFHLPPFPSASMALSYDSYESRQTNQPQPHTHLLVAPTSSRLDPPMVAAHHSAVATAPEAPTVPPACP